MLKWEWKGFYFYNSEHLLPLPPSLPPVMFFLCSPDYPGTHYVDHAGLELRDLPICVSWVLGLKGRATTPWLQNRFLMVNTNLNPAEFIFFPKTLF